MFDLCYVKRMLAPIERVDTHTLIFNDNVINNLNVGNTDSLIFSGTVIDKLIFKNNVIDGFCGVGAPVSRIPRNTYMKNKFTVLQFSGNRAGNLMHDYNSGIATKKCRGFINIKLVDEETPSHEVKFDFIVDNNLITFYENGNIRRIFPLYGQINGYWTEENEYELAEEITLPVLGTELVCKPLCIHFYYTLLYLQNYNLYLFPSF